MQYKYSFKSDFFRLWFERRVYVIWNTQIYAERKKLKQHVREREREMRGGERVNEVQDNSERLRDDWKPETNSVSESEWLRREDERDVDFDGR